MKPNDFQSARIPAGATDEAEQDERLYADTMERVRQGATGGFYGGIAVAVAFAFLFHDIANPALYWGWIGAFALHLLVRAPQLLRPLPASDAAVHAWSRRFVIGLAVAGTLWGLSATAFFPATDSAGRYLLTATQYVVAIMSVAAFSWYPRAFAVFITPLFALMSLPWFLHGSPHAWTLLFLTFATYLVLMDYVFRNAKVLIAGLAMRYEREALLAQLVERTDEAERANVGKTRFLASASHDLRQPLHALGLLSAHAVNVSRDPALDPVLHQMQSMTRVLGELVDALLDISRLDAGAVKPSMQRFKLQEVLDSVVEDAALVAENKGLTLRVRRSSHWTRSDPVMLGRIVQNLLANAIRYTPNGGVLLATRERAGRLSVEIWDTGIGIDQSEQKNIFGEFVQLDNPARDRTQGLGLGLAIVARLSALLDCGIAVRSRVGRGSVFVVTLPIAAPDAKLRGSTPALPDEVLDGTRIMLIEDDAAVLEATRMLLQSWGCQIFTAVDFDSALNAMHVAASEIDIVITDHRLGEKSGIDIAHALRARATKTLPVMVVTGDIIEYIDKSALAEPCVFLSKPLAAISLRAALMQMLKTNNLLKSESPLPDSQ